MALTATATPRIRIDIMRSLAMSPTSTTVLSNSFDRKNLALRVLALRAGGFFHNLAFLSDAFRLGDKGSTIVYVATTKNVDAISDYLSSDLQPYGGIVMPYHAKLTHGQRETAHRAFLTGQCHVIVATVAFGMGIDKPDIRRVINYGAPKCLEVSVLYYVAWNYLSSTLFYFNST
jgi:ATP-dependent DNA helicase RecQ